VNWPVVVVVLALFAGLGVLIGWTYPQRWTWPLVVLGFAGAGLVFIPVRCASGVVASPFNDVTGLEKPTGCEGLAGVRLPELGPLSSDTVGYGLAIGAVVLAGWMATLALARRANHES
jgi:hypothetical protein